MNKIKKDKQAYKQYINYMKQKNIYGFNGYKVLMKHYGSKQYINWAHLEASCVFARLQKKSKYTMNRPETIAETIVETRDIKHKIEIYFSFRQITNDL